MKHLPQMLVVVSFLTMSSCATLDGSDREKNMTLTGLESLSIEHTTKDNVRSLFGEGTMQLGSEKEQRLVWIYFLTPPGYQRLSVAFDSKSDLLQSMTWFVSSNEPEDKLEIALARFPHAHFVSHSIYHQVADSIDIIKSYDDENLGISVYLSSNDREVASISFYKPGQVKEYKDELTWNPKKSDYRILVDNYHKSAIQGVQSAR
jgi:hypothetical protein